MRNPGQVGYYRSVGYFLERFVPSSESSDDLPSSRPSSNTKHTDIAVQLNPPVGVISNVDILCEATHFVCERTPTPTCFRASHARHLGVLSPQCPVYSVILARAGYPGSRYQPQI